MGETIPLPCLDDTMSNSMKSGRSLMLSLWHLFKYKLESMLTFLSFSLSLYVCSVAFFFAAVCLNSYGDDAACQTLAGDGACSADSEQFEWMIENCQRSCGFCVDLSETTTTSSPTLRKFFETKSFHHANWHLLLCYQLRFWVKISRQNSPSEKKVLSFLVKQDVTYLTSLRCDFMKFSDTVTVGN